MKGGYRIIYVDKIFDDVQELIFCCDSADILELTYKYNAF